ncbi:MAG: DUF3567 domain-containing protein [Burkholderiales bacterium]|nr:DUF3567 domain-containing protein [Burkholderiales bacterium]MDE2395092.1 DUF3567 domain-containing protein [Burkholderiales bacterium]MDE2454708.1 DUF3567 domain-containing protein [Burkholderiales bacterium]
MQMLYNSDSFAVVQLVAEAEDGPLARGGYEIVDKFARKEIFIEGAVAESFERGVQALIEARPESAEAFDEFIERYTQLAQQPLMVH